MLRNRNVYSFSLIDHVFCKIFLYSANGLLTVPSMTGSLGLVEDGQFTGDGILDFLTEHNEFLVVGCLGLQGVGKSTLMSKLCGNAEKLVYRCCLRLNQHFNVIFSLAGKKFSRFRIKITSLRVLIVLHLSIYSYLKIEYSSSILLRFFRLL